MTLLRERFLEAILESAIDYAIIAMDLDGHVTSWNEGAHRILGWTSDEMVGRPAAIFFTQADRQNGVPQGEMRAALNSGRGSDERWHEKKDGTRFWASGEMMPLRDEDGVVQGFLKILRDRTAERRSAEMQRADAEFLRGVLSASVDCIKVLDIEGAITFVSEGGIRAMEITAFDAIRGRPWLDFWKDEGRRAAEAALQRAKSGEIGRFQGPANTMAGTPKWWDVQVTPILGSGGAPEKLLVVSRDISAIRKSEEENRRYRLLIEQSTDLIAMTDLSGQTLFLNESVRALIGSPDDTNQTTVYLSEFIAPEDLPQVEDEILPLLRTGAQWQGEIRFRHLVTRTEFPVWFHAFPIIGEDGAVTAFATVTRDISEQKRIEAELRELNATLERRIDERTRELQASEEQLRQSQKLEALGQLTGGVAHDFNNLLTGIIGNIELLQTRIAQGRMTDLDRFIQAAQGASRRAAALTHRLLAFARRQTLDPKPTDANRLIAEMQELVQRTVGPAIALETRFQDEPWTTLCDQNQLENAVLNLCINARDAMPDGGSLVIGTENVRLNRRDAQAHELAPGEYVAVSVSDTGTGMSPEVITLAFDPFFTTKPTGQGTGLGLSMVYGFARQSGGQIRILSELGRGTTMCLYLPRHPGEAEDAKPGGGALTRAPRAGASETVLVVDDEPAIRMLVTEVLSDLGYKAIEAPDGPAGLKILETAAQIDLLITDVGLPGGMNGRQVADAGRTMRPDLRVLFITGYAEKAALGSDGLEAGMQVLIKPFAMETLATTIRTMIAG